MRYRKRSKRTLNREQLVLLVGGCAFVPRAHVEESKDEMVDRVFGSLEEMRAAYLEHRDEVMLSDPIPGCRPFAWWMFEAPADWPGERGFSALPPPGLKIRMPRPTKLRPVPFDQARVLKALGLLTEYEERHLGKLPEDAA